SAYLEQSPVYPEGMKARDVLYSAFEEVDRIEVEMRKLENDMSVLEGNELDKALSRYSELIQLFEVKGGYEKEEKISKVCTGLQLTESLLERDFDLLSGGEKT
ncbi:hypothetical protein R0J90_14300, partial [Micrococcus sp. SIMBA_144]